MIERLGLPPLAHQELGDLAVERGPALRLGGSQRHAEDADDLPRLAAGRVVAAQLAEGARTHRRHGAGEGEDALQDGHRGLRARRVGEQRQRLVERLGRARQPVEQARRDLRPPRLRRRRVEIAEVRAPQVDQLSPAPLALQEALQRLGDLPVARRQLGERLQVLDGAIGAPGQILGDLRGLAVQLGAARRLRRSGDDPIVERQQLVPAPLDRVLHGEPPEGPVGGGIDGQRAVQHGGHGGAVLEPLGEEADRALAELQRQLGWDLGVDDGAVGVRHVLRALEIGREPLGLVPQLRALGGGGDGGDGLGELGRRGRGRERDGQGHGLGGGRGGRRVTGPREAKERGLWLATQTTPENGPGATNDGASRRVKAKGLTASQKRRHFPAVGLQRRGADALSGGFRAQASSPISPASAP